MSGVMKAGYEVPLSDKWDSAVGSEIGSMGDVKRVVGETGSVCGVSMTGDGDGVVGMISSGGGAGVGAP